MDIDSFKKWLAALWLSLPATALHYWLSWDRLPERIPTKYNSAGRAIAWALRPDALWVLLGIPCFMLVVMTGLVFLVAYQRPERVRAVLIIFSAVIAVAWFFENRFIWSLAHG
jgi:uncharacterized membrane protein